MASPGHNELSKAMPLTDTILSLVMMPYARMVPRGHSESKLFTLKWYHKATRFKSLFNDCYVDNFQRIRAIKAGGKFL